jgi:hypothetical protein
MKTGIDDYESFKEEQRLKKIIKSNLQNIEKEKNSKFSAYQYSGTCIDLYFIPLSLSLYKNNINRNKSIHYYMKKQRVDYIKEKAEKSFTG